MKIFEQLDKINPNDSLAYEKYFSCFARLNGYPVFSLPIKKGTILFRSRLNTEEKDFLRFEDLLEPPKNKVLSYSRLNRPFQSVFYSSSHWQTSLVEITPQISETDPSIGDVFRVTMGEYVIEKDFFITVIPDFENQEMKETVDIIEKNISKKDKKFLEKINLYITQDTIENPDIYILTSAFFNLLDLDSQKKGEKNRGFIYSSIQNKIKTERGINIALKPLAVNEALSLIRVSNHFIKVIDIEDEMPKMNNFIPPVIASNLDMNKGIINW